MTTPDPPKPPQGGLVSQAADRLFSYADKPWKAAVVIVVLVLGGLGWVAYQHQEEIIESMLTPSDVGLKIEDVPKALEKLVGETDADLIQVWSVSMESNSQHFIAARRRDGERPVIPTPRRLPIIVTVSDVRALERILDGHPVCVDLTEEGSPLARRLASRGMKRGCAIPIPPTATRFVGVIYLGWTSPPDASSEAVAVGAAREIASDLITR